MVKTSRVLVADDKADIRTLLAVRLGIETGLEVVGEAVNGAEAIARAQELRPDLMILDLQMPVMSGEEVIPVVRSLSPQLRIVVFSAYAGSRRPGEVERPDAEVRKGSGLTALMREVHRLLEVPPPDVVGVDLGPVSVEPALHACRAWGRLNPSAREAAAAEGREADFLALVGVFLALTERLQAAARVCLPMAPADFETRLEAGRAARRALTTFEEPALEPLRTPLLRALPT